MAAVKGLKIVILSNGSRGDVQPFAGLGHGLKQNGADVIVLANSDHQKFIEGLGLKFISNGMSFSDWFTSEPCVKAMSANDVLQYIDKWTKYNVPVAEDFQERVYKGIETSKPDLVLCSTNHWTDRIWISIIFKIPTVILNLSAWGCPYKPAFGLPMLPFGMNILMWKIVVNEVVKSKKTLYGPTLERLSGRPLGEIIETNEEAMANHGYGDSWSFVPYIVAQDLNVIPKHPEDPNHAFVHYPGFLTVPAEKEVGAAFGGDQSTALDSFIATCSTPPVYIGWGSVSCVSPKYMTCIAVRALKIAGYKGIILGGWADLQEKFLEGQPDANELKAFCKTEVLFMKTAAHETLFSRCSCLVHHGGIGTTIAGLRSGTPAVVTPIFYDQFDSAEIVEKSGTGIQSKPLVKVTPEELASHIKTCVNSQEMQTKAKEKRDVIHKRDALQEAVDIIATFYQDDVLTGKFQKHMDAFAEQKKAATKTTYPKLFGCCQTDNRHPGN